MKSKFEKKPGSIIHLEVQFAPEEFKVYWDKFFELELGKIHLKGFRPGQAPRDLAGKAVNPERVFEQAANEAIRHSLNELTEENKWTLIDKPNIVIDSSDGLDLKYSADLILFPEVELGDYKKLAKKSNSRLAERLKKIRVEEKEINDSIDWLKKSGADLKNFKNEDELKKSIGDGLKLEKETREKESENLKLLEELTENSEMDIPKIMIERVKNQGQTEEQAKKNVGQHLIIFKIAQVENLNPTPEEVGEEMRIYVSHHPQESRKVDKQRLYDYIYGVIQNRKVFTFLSNL